MSTSELLTPQQVVNYLTGLGRELDTTVNMLKGADLDAAEKRHAANVTESSAFVNADGSMELRKHAARLSAARMEKDALVAEALVRHLKASIRALETRIDIGRSYGAAVRAEINNMSYDRATQ